MQIKIMGENGYSAAKYGFSLSFKDRSIKPDDWWNTDCFYCDNSNKISCAECEDKKINHYTKVLEKNASRDGGHNKFLEHIIVWLDIEASLEWWKQFDTYRVGVSKQSESTMHTLDKRDIVVEDFDLTEEELKMNCISDTTDIGDKNPTLDHILGLYLTYLNHMNPRLKSKLLPQGYLQRREVVLSYKVLRHIIKQRSGHKLPEWQLFIEEIMRRVEHPEFLEDCLSND